MSQELNQEAQNSSANSLSFHNMARLNADNSSKRAVCYFWVVFAFFEIVILITSNFTPQAFVFKTNESQLKDTKHSQCQNPVEFSNGMLSCHDFELKYPKLGLIMRDLSSMNQFAQINLLFIPKNKVTASLTIKQAFKVELMSLVKKELPQNENKKMIVFYKGQDVRNIDRIQFDSNEYQLQPLQLTGMKKKTGYEVNLGYYRDFISEDALLVVTFIDMNPDYIQNYEIVAQAVLMNPTYTKFMLIIRAIFLAIMVTAFVIFLKRQSGMAPEIEQRVVMIVSAFSILFNDPYYFIEVFKPNLFSLILSTSFISTFFMAVMLSWIIMLQKIVKASHGQLFFITRKRQLIYASIAGVYFILMFFFIYELGYYSYYESPIVPAHSSFSRLYMVTAFLSILIFLYIGYLYLAVAREWDNVLWRDKIYATFNIFFILLNLAFISLGWLSFYDESSQKFQIFYASMNFYVIYLQYMYSTPLGQSVTNGAKVHQLEDKSLTTDTKEEANCVTIDLEDYPKQFISDLPQKEQA